METLPMRTPTQALLLRAAARRADGRVIPPANLRPGAPVAVTKRLGPGLWISTVVKPGDAGYPAQP